MFKSKTIREPPQYILVRLGGAILLYGTTIDCSRN